MTLSYVAWKKKGLLW